MKLRPRPSHGWLYPLARYGQCPAVIVGRICPNHVHPCIKLGIGDGNMAVRGIVAVQRGRVAEKIRGFIRSFNVFCIGCTCPQYPAAALRQAVLLFPGFPQVRAGGCRQTALRWAAGQVGCRRTCRAMSARRQCLCQWPPRTHLHSCAVKSASAAGTPSTKQCRQWRGDADNIQVFYGCPCPYQQHHRRKRRYGFMRGVTYCKYCLKAPDTAAQKANSK